MKGRISDFSFRDNSGIISGDDSARYTFTGGEWKGDETPKNGMRVDFQTSDTEALNVYLAIGELAGDNIMERITIYFASIDDINIRIVALLFFGFTGLIPLLMFFSTLVLDINLDTGESSYNILLIILFALFVLASLGAHLFRNIPASGLIKRLLKIIMCIACVFFIPFLLFSIALEYPPTRIAMAALTFHSLLSFLISRRWLKKINKSFKLDLDLSAN